MKKLFSMLLVTVLCVSMLSTAALADGRTPITWTAYTSEKQEIDGLLVWDTIEDMFDVDIKLQRYEVNDYETKTNLALTVTIIIIQRIATGNKLLGNCIFKYGSEIQPERNVYP